MTPDNALQAGLFSRLTNYTPLTTALGGPKVFDFVPESATPPFVVIGDDTATDWDTKDSLGWEFTVTIHAWSFEATGRKQVKTLIGYIYDALHQQEASVTVTGFNLVQIRHEFHQTFQDAGVEGQNDRYWHGVIRFRAVVEQI